MFSQDLFESQLQEESRAYDTGHREAIVEALKDLASRAQRQVVRTQHTATRACATDVDRHSHQQDYALAHVLTLVLQSARQNDTGLLVEVFNLVMGEIFVHQSGNA